MHRLVSETERWFVVQGCEAGIREDGRGPRDRRIVKVEVDVLPHINGSARVVIAEVIEVLCSIKLDVAELTPGSPHKGKLEVAADFSPSCNLKLDERRLNDVGAHLAQQLQRVLIGSLESVLSSLCIIPDRFCWRLHIDLLVTKLDGDPLDACSMAIYAALKCTKVPRVELVRGPSGLAVDFEVVGDPSSALAFPAGEVPLCTTFVKVGNTLVADASSSEHACASSALTVAMNRHGQCCGMFKLGGGGALTETEVLKVLSDAQALVSSTFNRIDKSGGGSATKMVGMLAAEGEQRISRRAGLIT